MKHHRLRTRFLVPASALCCVAFAPYVGAQTVPTDNSASASADQEQAIQLSPFVVDAATDQNGYRANSTLAGTRVRTDLKDIASAISVVTEQFLKDTGATNNADLLVYTPSTEVSGIRGNFTGVAGNPIYQENTVSTTTRVRGLDQADNTRNYFLTDIPWDSFNVGRIDLQRGPNSILFGTGSPAGIINSSTNDAGYKTTHNLENRVDPYGSVRDSIDLNQVIVPNILAVRVAALKDDKQFEQKPAFNNSNRFYAAVKIDPQIFGEDNRTHIRVNFESGRVNSNNPRELPPNDTITPWFRTGADAYGNPGYNKLTINQFNVNSPFPTGVVGPTGLTSLPGGKGGSLANATYSLGSNQGRSYWPDIINYYEATPIGINNVVNPNPPGGTPIKTIVAQPNTANGIKDSGGNTLGGVFPGFLPMAIPLMSQYAFNIQNAANGFGVPQYPGSPIPGGVYYADVVLQDPSIFNFYKKLLDGPNKSEWQNWKAYNFVASQGFFDDRLAFEVAVDHQAYTSGARPWLQGQQYAINVDVNQTYADGTPNPNVGRPYAATAASAPGQNQQSTTTRDSLRFTPTAEVRASDILGNSALAKILGTHHFTGLYERDTVVRENITWAEFATTSDYITSNSPNANAANTLGSNRSFEWLAYLGPSLMNAKSAANANLSNINYIIAPPKSQQFTNFNATWNKPTNPNDPRYVDPNAPFTYTNYATGATVNGHQLDNPANYVGWQQQTVNWLRDTNPADFPDLVQSASRTRYRDNSKGITWQGYLLDGDLVPTFGWRKDSISNYDTNAYTDPNSGFTSLNYPDNPNSRTDVRGESKSWGVVYHFPKSLMSKLPGDTTFSVFLNKGQNFQADASRLSMSGLPIPNATGRTTEYGVTLTTLHDKLVLKVTKFKTRVANATLADTAGNSIGGLGANGYFIADGSIWGYAWATSLQDGLRGQTPGTNYFDYATNDGFTRDTPANIAAANNYNLNGGTSPNGTKFVGGQAIVNAWLNAPFPSTFFSSYALTPALDPTIGAKTGNLRDSYPAGYADQNGPVPGGGSSFGNHQTTVDNLSDGTEVELTYQPTKTWNMTVNYSKVHATHENIDPVSQAFIGAMTKFMNGPGGQVREWYNGGGTLGAQWNASIVAPYTVELNELGHEAPEVSPWRLNAISTYTFTGEELRLLKGVFIGGAFRIESGRIIGYHFDPNFKNANSNDPNYAGVTALTLGGLNVNQPFRGANEHHVDAWVGYSRKISHEVNWRIQLNVRSVGESDRLVAARVNPDGSIALARIVQGMGFELTNSFDF